MRIERGDIFRVRARVRDAQGLDDSAHYCKNWKQGHYTARMSASTAFVCTEMLTKTSTALNCWFWLNPKKPGATVVPSARCEADQ